MDKNTFFKNYLNATADILDISFKRSRFAKQNSADIGEVAELFVKYFLEEYLSDHFRVHRGGNIVNLDGEISPQLDVVLTNKTSLKIFDDKGIYTLESVIGVFCVTSTLYIDKLKKDIAVLSKIPKQRARFHMQKIYGKNFFDKNMCIWKNFIPFSCIFAFAGSMSNTWIKDFSQDLEAVKDKSLWPDIILVNKVGFFEKQNLNHQIPDIVPNFQYCYWPLENSDTFGFPLSRILFQLYTLSEEQNFMRPDYALYFERDFSDIDNNL